MRNDSGDPVRVARGAKLYEADSGAVIDVYRVDVRAMADRGFVRVDQHPEPPAGDGLDDLTVAELTDLARERDLPGRSTLNRGELIAALRDTQE